MAKSGFRHIDVGAELTKTEWESEESHELIHGNSFPSSPVERQLFYRDDEHKWYIYNGSAWVDLQGTGGGGMETHGNEYHSPDFEEEGVAATQIEAHRQTETHVTDQPPEVHGNTKHSPDFEEEGAAAAQIAAHAALSTNVHGIQGTPIFSAEAKTYYIDAVSGDDGNSGEASDDAFKTWGKAEGLVPMFLLHSYTIRIIGNMAEDVDIRGRIVSGSAILLIRGNTDTPGSHQVNKITLQSMLGDFRVQYLQATHLIGMKACSGTHIQSMYKLEPRCPEGSALWAIYTVGGFVYFNTCDFGTDVVKDCIYIDGCHLVSRDNSGNGTQYGLHARGGGTIGKKGTQPTGTVANEYTADGGVIR